MNIFDFIITMPVVLTDFAETVWDVLSYEVNLGIASPITKAVFGIDTVSGIGLIFGVGLIVIVVRRIVGAVAL